MGRLSICLVAAALVLACTTSDDAPSKANDEGSRATKARDLDPADGPTPAQVCEHIKKVVGLNLLAAGQPMTEGQLEQMEADCLAEAEDMNVGPYLVLAECSMAAKTPSELSKCAKD